MRQAHRIRPLIRGYLDANFSGIEMIPETEFPTGRGIPAVTSRDAMAI